MSEPYRRLRTFYQDASGALNVTSGLSGVQTLASVKTSDTLYLQKIHIEVTTGVASKTWTVQDSANTPVVFVPAVDASAVAHFDFDFGPQGIPATEAKNLTLSISAAGSVGWVTWEAYIKRTAVVSA
jgi:hypothetical protein